MGLDAILRVIPASEYRKLRADPKHYITREVAKFDLYREWSALDAALNKLGGPASLAIRGNRPSHEAFEDSWETYFAHATPAFVKKIHRALAKISQERLIAALKDAGWQVRKYEHKTYWKCLETLKEAYRLAAKQSACVSILIC
jgi:hypothetical protein